MRIIDVAVSQVSSLHTWQTPEWISSSTGEVGMNTRDITNTLVFLFRELVDGTRREAYMLNPDDPGLLKSLERTSAAEASKLTVTGSSVAAHVDHLRYGLSLMNRWTRGENPFAGADWAESWKKTSVSEEQWRQLRSDLQSETTRWREVLGEPRDVSEDELKAIVGSIAHLAYHLGAIRQISQAARGPREGAAR
jgi:hypothetical protein